MRAQHIFAAAIITCCLMSLIVLPSSAAAIGQGTNDNTGIDQGLKTDLWNNHIQYRLQEFDNHVQNGNNIIGILDKYDIDTTKMQTTLSTISGLRPELQAALQNEDRAGLKTINSQLVTLWTQFRTEANQTIRNHYRTAQPVTVSGITGT